MRPSRVVRLTAPAVLLSCLAGCSLLTLEDESEAAEPSEVAACALGHTWTADVQDLAAQVLSNLQSRRNAANSAIAAGYQRLQWAENGIAVLDVDYTIKVTAPAGDGQVLTLNQTHDGTATGLLFLNGSVAIPSDWDITGLTVKNAFDLNGTDAPDRQFRTAPTMIDDTVGIEVTCEADVLTTKPREGVITTKWTKVS